MCFQDGVYVRLWAGGLCALPHGPLHRATGVLPLNMAAGFPENEPSKKASEERPHFYLLVLEVTSHYFRGEEFDSTS